MANKPQGRFLVQFTDYATYEFELDACTEQQALELASALHRMSATPFTLVERNVTDWIAISVEPVCSMGHRGAEPDALAQPDTPAVTWCLPAARMMEPRDLQDICELLDELRDTTLQRSTFEKTSRLLDLIRPH